MKPSGRRSRCFCFNARFPPETHTPYLYLMNNVLFIMCDQLRADALGFVGKFPVKTPNIDKLAEEGTVFSNAYCANPVCVPSRASIMTGTPSYENGVYYNDQPWPDSMQTFADVMRDNSFYTTLIGKTHFQPKRRSGGFQRMVHVSDHGAYLQSKGVTEKRRPGKVSDADALKRAYPIEPTTVPLEHYKPVYLTDQAIHELERVTERRECGPLGVEPFLMKLSYTKPHSPCNPPEPYFSMYQPEDLPAPARSDEERATFSKQYQEWVGIWDQLEDERVLKHRAQYFGCVTLVDDMIGRVVDKLKELGIYDNTLIIFTSDHGDHLCDHHSQQKAFLYDCSTKVPLIFRGPGIPAGKVVEEEVSQIDLSPTILDYCQLLLPERRDPDGNLIYCNHKERESRSLMPYFQQDGPVDPEYIVVSENAMHGQHFMMKRGNLKINVYVYKDGSKEFDVFHLDKDPDELHNQGKDFTEDDMPDDFRAVYEKVLAKQARHADGWYFFQDKVRPMYT